jgi:hypothetical protein
MAVLAPSGRFQFRCFAAVQSIALVSAHISVISHHLKGFF